MLSRGLVNHRARPSVRHHRPKLAELFSFAPTYRGSTERAINAEQSLTSWWVDVALPEDSQNPIYDLTSERFVKAYATTAIRKKVMVDGSGVLLTG